MRLIDADKLKEYIDDCECCEKCDQKGFMCNDHCELPDCVTPQWERMLNEQPTVDAEPVRHGVWKKSEEKEWWWYCSNCQEHYFEDDLKINEKQFPNYCPNCGARMR